MTRSFTHSRPRHSDVTHSAEQTWKFSFGERQRLLNSKNVACVYTVDQNNNIVPLYNPIMAMDLSGEKMTKIFGNGGNYPDDIAVLFMEASKLRMFPVACPEDQLPKGVKAIKKVPLEAAQLAGTKWADEPNIYLYFMPASANGFYGFLAPKGPITEAEVEEQCVTLGEGMEDWFTSVASYVQNQTDIWTVMRRITTTEDRIKFGANHREGAVISTCYTTLTVAKSAQFPDKIQAVRQWFEENATAPRGHASVVAPSNITVKTAETLEQEDLSKYGLNKLQMMLMGANIDFVNCKITNPTKAQFTAGFADAASKTKNGRVAACQENFTTSIAGTKKGDITSALSNVTIEVLPTVFINLLLSGSFATSPLNTASSLSKQAAIHMCAFLPQDAASSIVQAAINYEVERRNNISASQSNKHLSQLLELLGHLTSLEDNVKMEVNWQAIIRAMVDLVEMKNQGSLCAIHQVSAAVLEWVISIQRDFPTWKKASGSDMEHLHFALYNISDNIMAHFAKFAGNVENQSIHDKGTNLSTTDFTEIENALKVLKEAKDRFRLLRINWQPFNQRVPIGDVFLAREGGGGQPRIEASGGGQTANRAPSTQRQGQQQSSNEDNRPSKRARSGGANSDTSARTAQSRVNGSRFGMIHLAPGKSPRDAIPPGVPLCPNFVCKQHNCDKSDCVPDSHATKLTGLKVSEQRRLLGHLRETRAGFVNVAKKDGLKADIIEDYSDVFGHANAPPSWFASAAEGGEEVADVPLNEFDAFEHQLQAGQQNNTYRKSRKSLNRTKLSLHSEPTPPQQPLGYVSQDLSSRAQSNRTAVVSSAQPSTAVAPPSRRDEGTTTIRPQIKHTKEDILQTYQNDYGDGFDEPIVQPKQGKLLRDSASIPNQCELIATAQIKQRIDAQYRAKDITFKFCVLPLFASGVCDMGDYQALRLVNSSFRAMVNLHLELLEVDVTPLFAPRYDFENQVEISKNRLDMATALFIYYGGDPAKEIRALGYEYTLAGLDRAKILSNVKDIISPQDYAHIERILYQGCPAKFQFDEPNENRQKWFDRGNQPSYLKNFDQAKKTLNKEDKKSHVLPIYQEAAEFSPYCHHTPQGLVVKQNANARVVWDGSTKHAPSDITMNELAQMEFEAPITFGAVESEFDHMIYNNRVSYPTAHILLATLDVSSCFRFGRIPPELTGAFGFSAGEGIFCLANAMVFGYKASASSWEPFRRAIEELSEILAKSPDAEELVAKHREYLDMICWEELEEDAKFVKAKGCPLCPGVIRPDGSEAPMRSKFYVDDGLLVAISIQRMKILLAATIEAIFRVMGEPTPLRTCPLSIEKLKKLIVGQKQILLGLLYDLIALTKGTTTEYRSELLSLMNEKWPLTKDSFTVKEIQTLVGKLARLAKGARWVNYLLSQMYDQIAFALASNKATLRSTSPKFRAYLQRIRQGQFGTDALSKDGARVVSFALKRAARLVHTSRQKYQITPEMRADIEFFRMALHPTSGISWAIPLAHVVRRTPFACMYGDACLTSAGGYSFGMEYWWHVPFPDEIVRLTLLYLQDNTSDKLISINVLEFVTQILNYCAALTFLETNHPSDDPYPVVLSVTDNTSALNWVNHRCKRSKIGKALSRFFVGLLMDSPLGINSEWIKIPAAGKLEFLGSAAAAALGSLERDVVAELSRNRNNQGVETQRTRQAYYLEWCKVNGAWAPVGPNPNYERLVALFLKDLMKGNNYHGRLGIRAGTIRGYADAVNDLFSRRRYPLPVNFSNEANEGARLISNLDKEQNIADQRAPLTDKIMAELINLANDTDQNSPERAVANIVAIGRYLGFRVSEYAQTQMKKIDVHKYESGNEVIKAFLLNDIQFQNDRGERVNLGGLTQDSLESVYSGIKYMTATWRIQKNRRNGQKVRLQKDPGNRALCPVYNALQLALRKLRIDRTRLDDTPLCVHKHQRTGETVYLTAKKVAEVIQKAVKKAMPSITKEDLKRYTAHSIRVWAAVLLDEQGKSATFIQSRLRWVGDSFRMYLRDTPKMSSLHREALDEGSKAIQELVSEMSSGTEDTQKGDYQDEMD